LDKNAKEIDPHRRNFPEELFLEYSVKITYLSMKYLDPPLHGMEHFLFSKKNRRELIPLGIDPNYFKTIKY